MSSACSSPADACLPCSPGAARLSGQGRLGAQVDQQASHRRCCSAAAAAAGATAACAWIVSWFTFNPGGVTYSLAACSGASFPERLVAFAAVSSVFNAGSFAGLYCFKKASRHLPLSWPVAACLLPPLPAPLLRSPAAAEPVHVPPRAPPLPARPRACSAACCPARATPPT